MAAGCSTMNNYTAEGLFSYNQYRDGRFAEAASNFEPGTDRPSRKSNAVLWNLEKGAILRAAGKINDSNKAFQIAEKIIGDFDSRATVSARSTGSEVLSLMTNLNALPYKGYAYDRIMLNTYKALNYISLGSLDSARVELLRAYEQQKNAIFKYKKDIEKAEKEAESRQINLDRLRNDKEFRHQFDQNYEALNELVLYKDYVNPMTVYLDGILFLAAARNGVDLERARKDFNRVKSMIGDNAYLQEDIYAVEKLISGTSIEPVVYILFENGVAPIKREIRIDVPVGFEEVSYIGAAFPALEFQPASIERLILSDDSGKIAETTLLSDMDAVIAQEFRNQLDVTILRTILASAVKAAAQYELRRNFGALGRISGTLYSIITTNADLRTWMSLPKEFQFARIKTAFYQCFIRFNAK